VRVFGRARVRVDVRVSRGRGRLMRCVRALAGRRRLEQPAREGGTEGGRGSVRIEPSCLYSLAIGRTLAIGRASELRQCPPQHPVPIPFISRWTDGVCVTSKRRRGREGEMMAAGREAGRRRESGGGGRREEGVGRERETERGREGGRTGGLLSDPSRAMRACFGRPPSRSAHAHSTRPRPRIPARPPAARRTPSQRDRAGCSGGAGDAPRWPKQSRASIVRRAAARMTGGEDVREATARAMTWTRWLRPAACGTHSPPAPAAARRAVGRRRAARR